MTRPHLGVVLPTREAIRADRPGLIADTAVRAEAGGIGS